MKAIRSKAVLLGLLGATAFATTWVTVKSAKAGAKQTYDVIINDAGKYAMGSLADARASGSTVSYLQVDVQSYGSDSWRSVRMVAKNGGNGSITRECISYDAELVALAANANGDSFVDFSWEDDGRCSNIRIVHGSKMSPKVP